MEGNDSWFIGSLGSNTSTSIVWITMTFGTDIPGPQAKVLIFRPTNGKNSI